MLPSDLPSPGWRALTPVDEFSTKMGNLAKSPPKIVLGTLHVASIRSAQIGVVREWHKRFVSDGQVHNNGPCANRDV